MKWTPEENRRTNKTFLQAFQYGISFGEQKQEKTPRNTYQQMQRKH